MIINRPLQISIHTRPIQNNPLLRRREENKDAPLIVLAASVIAYGYLGTKMLLTLKELIFEDRPIVPKEELKKPDYKEMTYAINDDFDVVPFDKKFTTKIRGYDSLQERVSKPITLDISAVR